MQTRGTALPGGMEAWSQIQIALIPWLMEIGTGQEVQ